MNGSGNDKNILEEEDHAWLMGLGLVKYLADRGGFRNLGQNHLIRNQFRRNP